VALWIKRDYFLSPFVSLKEKLKAFQERVVEEKTKRLEDRKRQRKGDRRTTFYREKEEEAQRVHEEQLKQGDGLPEHPLLLFASVCCFPVDGDGKQQGHNMYDRLVNICDAMFGLFDCCGILSFVIY